MRDASTSLRSRIGRHPVAAYIPLTFLISYGAGIPFMIAAGAWAPGSGMLHTYLGRALVVYGPALSALLVCYLSEDLEAARRLLRKLRPRRRDAPWWVALPLLGLSVTGAALLLAGVPIGGPASAFQHEGLLFLGHLVLQGAVVGVGEELGWRGWLLPALLRRYTPAVATVCLALVWGLWHGPALLGGWAAAGSFLLGIAGLSFLMTWLWTRVDGNIGVLALAHASVNAPLFFLEQAAAGPGPEEVQRAWNVACLLYAVGAALLVVFTRRQWCVRPSPGSHPFGRDISRRNEHHVGA